MGSDGDWLALARDLALRPQQETLPAMLRDPPAWPEAAAPPDPPGLVAGSAAATPAGNSPATWHARRLVARGEDPLWRRYHARWLWYLLAPEDPAARPRVSVVTATYNRADTIVEAVESALAQDWPAVEVIVVDDASTDDTLERLAAFGDRIRLLRLPENGGVSAARNAGLAVAEGEMVQFLDSDDLLLPGSLSSKIAAFAARPAAGLAFSEIEHVGLYDGKPRPRPLRVALGAPNCATQAPLHALIGRFFMMPSCVMFPRPLIEQVGRFDERLRRHEDRLFYGRLGMAGAGVIAVDRPLCRIRVHGKTLSRTHDDRLDNVLAGLLLLHEVLARPDLWWLVRDLLAMPHWDDNWPTLLDRPPDDPRWLAFESLLSDLEALAAGREAPDASPVPLAADMAAALETIRGELPWKGPHSARLDAAIARCAAARPPGPADLAAWRQATNPGDNAAALGAIFQALSRDLRRSRPWVPLASLDGRPFRSIRHSARRRWRLLARVARTLGEGPAKALARVLG